MARCYRNNPQLDSANAIRALSSHRLTPLTAFSRYVQEACSKAQAYEAMSINVAESGRHTLLAVCLGGAQSRLNYDVVLEVRNSRRSDPTIWHPILAHRISSRFRLVPACPSLPHPALSCPTPSHSNSPHLTSLNRRRRALGRSRPS